MVTITKRETLAKTTLFEIGYKYLVDNFHKFKEGNKIKVALTVLQIFEKDDSKTKDIQSVINIVRADQQTNLIAKENNGSECEADRISGQIPLQQ